MKKYLSDEDCDKLLDVDKSNKEQRITALMIDQGITYQEAKKIVEDTDSLLS
ncbi:MAG: hypothetical protein AWU59_1273 [Methanolobus sp. T82-4]|jgi:hypothetical protein|nr:MAG: hypothetical protein AWU59_1273 [Methanolobus sp. T82-4]